MHKMSAPWWKWSGCVRFILTLSFVAILNNVIGAFSEAAGDYFLCRKCGHEVVHLKDLTTMPSATAHRQRNDTFGPRKGVLIQLFKNPHNKFFEVITSSHADVHTSKEEYMEDTWFKDYSWKFSLCPRCGAHLGWKYVPMNKHNEDMKPFHGLVLANLLYQDELESLLVEPKVYAS